jgi:hypothetical protein
MQTRYVVAAFALLAALVYLSIKHVPSPPPTDPTTQTPVEARSNTESNAPAPTKPASSAATSRAQAQASTTVAAAPAIVQPQLLTEPKVEPIHVGELHRQAIEKFKALTGGQDEITPLHEALANESRDIEWSYGMEERLNRFLVGRGAELGIEAPVIACRKTGCEIQLVTYKKPPAFDQLLGALRQEPWFNLTTVNQARVPVSSDAIVGWLFLKRP